MTHGLCNSKTISLHHNLGATYSSRSCSKEERRDPPLNSETSLQPLGSIFKKLPKPWQVVSLCLHEAFVVCSGLCFKGYDLILTL